MFTALAALWAVGSTPTYADWIRAESPNFVVHSTASEGKLREQVILLEDFDRLLRKMTTAGGEPAPNKLHVYIARGNRELQIVQEVGKDVAGYYVSSPGGIVALVDSRASTASNEILFHEYAHHFMHQYAPGAYPVWYVEGFAEYFMTTQFDARHIDVGQRGRYRAAWVVDRAWLPMDRVLFGDLRGLNAEEIARFYAQSWLAVHYFFSTDERKTALRRYFSATMRGADWQEAFEVETGFTPDQFAAELKDYISHRRITFNRFRRDSSETPPPVSVTTLPRSAKDLLLYEVALRIGIPDDRKETHLETIRKSAARHVSDPYAQRVLAHAEALHGDPATADRLLEALLAASPDDAELLYIKGMRHYTAAENGADWDSEMRTARQWFVRAHQVDENHFPTLYRYAQSLSNDENYASENTANVLVLAHNLAPQVSEIGVAAAYVLLHRQDFLQAEAILTPLATNPHNPELAKWARRQIARARQQGQEVLEAGDR